MSKTIRINTISEAHQIIGLPAPNHPLVSVVKVKDFQNVLDLHNGSIILNLYLVHFKQVGSGSFNYGRNSYDYKDGTLLFTAPGQVAEFKKDDIFNDYDKEGWKLAFHPDLIRKSELGKIIDRYSFFNYDVSEALHISEKERNIIEDILDKIVLEYNQETDSHSQNLITSNIELLLDYCVRFYDRQFNTRTNLNNDIISKFEKLLQKYYQTNAASEMGIPNVDYCARELNLSPNYLSDLLKKVTGKAALEHIHLYVIEKAKNYLLTSNVSISEIGYELGFKYPQHFSSLFRLKTGFSPKKYRFLDK